MKKSRRARRMERHHRRARRTAGLHLISLMDIFTILVFFLLVNSSDVQDVPNRKAIELPTSIADQKPRETLVVMVTGRDIIVQGHSVASVAEVEKNKALVIEPLRQALLEQAGNRLTHRPKAGQDQGEVTIMGDKSIPYDLLKRVMATCTKAGFGQVSLAVLEKSLKGEKS